jgi:SAM-dependent methyltransferase
MNKFKDTWEYFGKNDPYFAVLTFDKFKSENLDDAAETEFFRSGQQHIERVWREIEDNLVPDFSPRRSLDFGCGVGRLVLPLAHKSAEVVGVDISTEMLAEAARNCERRNLANTSFAQADELFKLDIGKFDFVHAFIVMQHINPKDGEKIFERFLQVLGDGGVGAIHLTYGIPVNKFAFLRARVYRDFPVINRVKNLLRRAGKQPMIPFYIYDLNRIFMLLQKYDCGKCIVRFSDHGQSGAFLFFQKQRAELY